MPSLPRGRTVALPGRRDLGWGIVAAPVAIALLCVACAGPAGSSPMTSQLTGPTPLASAQGGDATETPAAAAVSVISSPAPTPPTDGSLTVTIENRGLVLPGQELGPAPTDPGDIFYSSNWHTSIQISVGTLWIVNESRHDHIIIDVQSIAGGGGERVPGELRVKLRPGEWAAVRFSEPGTYRLTDDLQPLVELSVEVT
jgi:hypothetical protein